MKKRQLAMAFVVIALCLFANEKVTSLEEEIYTRWETFHVEDGLPNNKVIAVAVQGNKVWAGTDDGLALYDGKRFTCWGPKDGLAYKVVSSLAVDEKRNILWIGTFGGLSSFDGKVFKTYNEQNSGLASDIVYGVAVQDDYVWAATTVGLNRFNPQTGKWDTYGPENTQFEEPWAYNVAHNGNKVHVAIWGGGLAEFDLAEQKWETYTDPDGDVRVDMVKNDGLLHDITTSVAYDGKGIVWVGSYFGLCRFDGKKWMDYNEDDSGLSSNFIVFLKLHGDAIWIASNNGLCSFDGKSWITYRPREGIGSYGEVVIKNGTGEVEKTLTTAQSIGHNFVWAIDFQGDDIWVGTSDGLSHSKKGGL